MDEALARIKRELGPDAVILSSREVRDASNRAAGTSYEVTAAPYESSSAAEVRPSSSANTSTFDARAVTLERKLLSGGVPMSAARTLAMRVRKTMRDNRSSFVDAVGTALRSDVSFA